MSRNVQGAISDGNETPLMQIRTVCARNVQGTISDGNETLPIQKRTYCEQKRAEDNQRWE